ncbi:MULTISPECIES: IclR family transcriptional regulator [unclassified Haladaptatus]|uniref:IclR family transcriptional regulator n=1 Tax=unclassified Haladaptatus TaxID=2622732 RepID=UPI0023E7B800|nr:MULTISPECIES: IclR family transcriptional regulator [unclassified Haladaptatus]
MMTNEARNPVKGVQTSLDIIDALQEHDRVGVTALANELGISKGTVHCHLATLRQNGYVVKDAGKYRLGLRFIDVAHRVRDRHALYDLVTDEVDELAKKSGELALFTVEEQHKGICLYKASGEQAVRTQLYVGYRNNLYHTAVGKAILAYKPQSELNAILEATDFESLTNETITDEQALRDELEQVRETGFAYNREETIPGLVGVGAPIRNQDGGVYGAISVIGPTSRMSDDRLEEISELIYHTVNVIEINATSL